MAFIPGSTRNYPRLSETPAPPIQETTADGCGHMPPPTGCGVGGRGGLDTPRGVGADLWGFRPTDRAGESYCAARE
jgi:hypothetical protein